MRFASKVLTHHFLLLLLILVGFATRYIALGTRELRFDEAFTCSFTFQSYSQIISETFRLGEPHPVGSYFIQHTWYLLTGRNEWAMRFPSAFFGVLAIPLLWRFSETIRKDSRAYPQIISFVVVAALIISPYALMHSRVMRMYSMNLVFTLASMLALARILVGHRRWYHYALNIMLSFAALHTHYYTGIIVAAQSLIVIIVRLTSHKQSHRQWHWVIHWFIAQLILSAAYLVWFIPASTLVSAYKGVYSSPSLQSLLINWLGPYIIGEHLYSWFDYDQSFRTFYAVVGGIITVIGSIKIFHNRSRFKFWGWFLLIYFLCTPVLVTLAAQSRPIFAPQYLIGSVPAFFLIGAYAITPTSKTRIANKLMAYTLGMVVLYGVGHELIKFYRAEFQDNVPHFKTLVSYVNRHTGIFAAEQEKFVMNYPEHAVPCYYYGNSLELLTIPPQEQDLAGSRRMVQELADKNIRRLIFQEVPSPYFDANGVARQAIEEKFTKVAEDYTGRWVLRVYSNPNARELEPLQTIFDQRIQFKGIALYPSLSGRLLEINFAWQTQHWQPNEKFFMHIVRAEGDNVVLAQLDPPLLQTDANGQLRAYGIRLPENLEAGNYRLRMGVYQAAVAGTPRLLNQQNQDAIDLAFTLK